MTSRKSFFNFRMMRDAIAECKYVSILHFVVLFLSTTLPALILKNNTTRSHEEIPNLLSGTNIILAFVTVLAGFVIATVMFSYLYKSNSTVFYHSMPYKRSSIFLTRYFGGVIALLTPYVLIFILNSFIYVGMGFCGTGGYSVMLQGLPLAITIYLVCFSVSAFAAVLSGTPIAQCIITAFVFLAFHISLLIISGNVEMWFDTYLFQVEGNAGYIIPPLFLFEPVSILNVIYSLAYALLFMLLGVWCYKHRKSENSNSFFAFNGLKVFLKYYITTFSALAFGLVMIGVTSKDNLLLYYVSYIAFAFVAYVALQAMFEQNYKSMFRNMKQFAVYAVIFAALLTIPTIDAFGIEKNAGNFAERKQLTVELSGRVSKTITLNDRQNIKSVAPLLEDAWESSRTNEKKPDDKKYEADTRNICVQVYDGLFFTIRRNFANADSNITEKIIAAIYDHPEVKAQLVPGMPAESYDSIEIFKFSSTQLTMEKNSAQMVNIINALKDDIQRCTYDDIQKSYLLATVSLQPGDQFKIYSCFSDTVNLIKDYIAGDYNPDEVKSVTVTDASGKTVRKYTITDKETIKYILLRTNGYYEKEGFEVIVDEYNYIGFIDEKDLPEYLLSE